MVVHEDFSRTYWEDPIRHWNFQDYAHLVADDIVLYVGNYMAVDPETLPRNPEHRHCGLERISPYRKWLIATEEQCRPMYCRDGHDQLCLPFCDNILTLAPLAQSLREKRTYIYFPLNENRLPKHIPSPSEKTHDVVYTGLAGGGKFYLDEILHAMPKFDYRFATFQTDNPVATDISPTYTQKLDIISKSRCTIVHNLADIDSPQIKSRPFEAAFCKSLILCRKDNFPLTMETWFTEGKHFLYYENLEETLTHVLANYSDYHDMIEETYQYAMNRYTCKHFVQDFLVGR